MVPPPMSGNFIRGNLKLLIEQLDNVFIIVYILKS